VVWAERQPQQRGHCDATQRAASGQRERGGSGHGGKRESGEAQGGQRGIAGGREARGTEGGRWAAEGEQTFMIKGQSVKTTAVCGGAARRDAGLLMPLRERPSRPARNEAIMEQLHTRRHDLRMRTSNMDLIACADRQARRPATAPRANEQQRQHPPALPPRARRTDSNPSDVGLVSLFLPLPCSVRPDKPNGRCQQNRREHHRERTPHIRRGQATPRQDENPPCAVRLPRGQCQRTARCGNKTADTRQPRPGSLAELYLDSSMIQTGYTLDIGLSRVCSPLGVRNLEAEIKKTPHPPLSWNDKMM